MIDLGYSALKDSLGVLSDLKKKYKNDQYTEEVEKQLKKISEKYDELLSEYKKVITEKKTEINLEKEHYDILKKIVENNHIIKETIIEQYVKKKGVDYQIAFSELSDGRYIEIQPYILGDRPEYAIVKRRTEVLKFIRDFERLNMKYK